MDQGDSDEDAFPLSDDGESESPATVCQHLEPPPGVTDMADDEGGLSPEEQERRCLWRASPFAVGLTDATWRDTMRHKKIADNKAPFFCTGTIFHLLQADRVGNMIVLYQRPQEVTIDGETRKLPKLIVVLGPYWFVPYIILWPLYGAFSFWVVATRLVDYDNLAAYIVWVTVTGLLVLSFLMVSTKDPGIMYRHARAPNDEWLWSDQALTWRPSHAKYDNDCAVVVERFDHVCPWTGTAIGGGNTFWFRMFVAFAVLTAVMDVVILMFGG